MSSIDWDAMARDWMAEVEVRLATRIRQTFRATAARDDSAVRDEIHSICLELQELVRLHLTTDPLWDSQGRWFDGLVRAQHELTPPDRVRISGELVWGLSSDSGGPQWSEPFAADAAISPGRTDLKDYCIRFGRKNDTGNSELEFGLFPSLVSPGDSIADPWGGRADWRYEFRKTATIGEEANSA